MVAVTPCVEPAANSKKKILFLTILSHSNRHTPAEKKMFCSERSAGAQQNEATHPPGRRFFARSRAICKLQR